MFLYSNQFTKFEFLNGQSVGDLDGFFQQTDNTKVRIYEVIFF